MKHQANNDSMALECTYRPKTIHTKQRVSTHYTIPLTGPIGDICEYGELVSILVQAREEDQIYIRLSSPGGSLETCDYLCRRMEDCRADITVEIGMTCASVASAIALQADDWVIHDSSTMAIQPTSFSPGYGKESDVRARSKYIERLNREWTLRTYKGFLSEDEIFETLEYGKDLYLYAGNLRERMPMLKDYREECKSREAEEFMRRWEQLQTA